MLAKRAANIKSAVTELANSYEGLKSTLNENETYTQVSFHSSAHRFKQCI